MEKLDSNQLNPLPGKAGKCNKQSQEAHVTNQSQYT